MRRIRFNLTPLLDVILLMVFAYQMQSLEQVAQSEALSEQADLRMHTLEIERNDLDIAQEKMVEENAELRRAVSNQRLGELAELVDELSDENHQSIQEALTKVSDENQKLLQSFIDRTKGKSAEGVVQELLKIESYRRYVSSWYIHLEMDRGFRSGVSQIRVQVDDAAPTVHSVDGRADELEIALERLIRDELVGELSKSQTTIVLTVIPSCDLYKYNKDEFVTVLRARVFPTLEKDESINGTRFLLREEEAKCQKEE